MDNVGLSNNKLVLFSNPLVPSFNPPVPLLKPIGQLQERALLKRTDVLRPTQSCNNVQAIAWTGETLITAGDINPLWPVASPSFRGSEYL